ncbi:alpha/beta hydrolase [Talaromyces proteolyticus]|uniref:Alpha/beta hydrolase n=1 Tax=Talaromyces proteolyticus TaxID=1131652 RepID=A0AAD4Q045_9EURO|nr:alpha/beta hydrolase [Talaromyces proteolyticus]KAH8700444.1 alpha/beta hydrolase [Talaromyces proteolyticus]
MSSAEAIGQASEDLHSRNDPGSKRSLPRSVAQDTAQPASSSAWFPLGMKEGFSQWWCKVPAATAEHKVLSFIPHLQQAPTQRQTGNTAGLPDAPTDAADSLQAPDLSQRGDDAINSENDPYGPRRWRSRMVELSGKGRALNEFSVERVGEKENQNLVILHGYGAGLGFFYKNFEPLSRAKGWHLYALDLLGMGRSTRPPFKIKAKNRQEAISEAEDWFIDALEEWRVKQKIDRFTLMGHSMGGYMAVAYALKYPGRLNKLILASPVGIPEDPYAVDEDLPEPSESTLASEFTQDQEEITSSSNNNNKPSNSNTGVSKQTSEPAPRRRLPRIISYLWDANVSPFSIIRWSGPMGPRLVSGWTSRRFSHLPAPEAAALHDYSYSIFRLRGSGEYALTYILAPGAFARSPLIRRIQGLGRQVLRPDSTEALQSSSNNSSPTPSEPVTSSSSSLPTSLTSQPQRENGIPVVLMYGDHDWMDVAGGFAAKEKIEEEKRRALENATAEQRKADNGSAKVVIIKNAGHHLYLDGYEEFNEVILKEMLDVEQREARRKL